jgi:Bacteriocin-protection, YdeI or OmpD-Associated/Domain of unknown function (DUF1905)
LPRVNPPKQFLATIYKIWMLRYVDVPEEIGRALQREYVREGSEARKGETKRGKYIPVVAIVNGRSARTTLTPGGGHYRLQFNATLRKAARADVGDVVGVELRLDRETRELAVPPELERAMKKRPLLRREFERLPPGGRMQSLRFMHAAKAPATREKRVKRMIEILLERALLRPRGKKKRT